MPIEKMGLPMELITLQWQKELVFQQLVENQKQWAALIQKLGQIQGKIAEEIQKL